MPAQSNLGVRQFVVFALEIYLANVNSAATGVKFSYDDNFG